MGVVPAVAQALAVLRYLGAQAQPAAAAAISRDLGLPRSTTYHLLDTLVRAGFVVHVAEERRYALGVAVYELASGYGRQTSLQRLARTPLAALVDDVGQTAHLAIMHGRDVIYVIEERAVGRPPLITDVGVRLPAQLTASGRAMLAEMPQAQVRALYSEPGSFALRNDLGPRSFAALRQLLAETRRRGFACEDGEVTPEFASVAVAARDRAGYPVAAVAVTFPSAEVDADERQRLAARVAKTAAELSRRLGSPPRPQETGSRKQGTAVSGKPEAGNGKQETGNGKPEAGSGKRETGNGKQEAARIRKPREAGKGGVGRRPGLNL